MATIHNDGTADTAVIFGAVVNGAKYMVGDLRVTVRRDDAPDDFRMYRPKHYPVRIGGRLDDWIVPLPAGASYGLLLAVRDFEGWRSMTSFQASTLELRLVVRAPSFGNTPIAVWTDRDALVSNQVHVPDDCGGLSNQ